MKRYSRMQLADKSTLSAGDMEEVGRCRRDHNRLGFAYQLGFVKLTGRLPKQDPLEYMPELLAFVGVQLCLNPKLIDDYQHRRETVTEHQDRIRSHLGLKRLGPSEMVALEVFMLDAASQLENTAALQAKAKEYLRNESILLPAESTLVVKQHKLSSNCGSGLFRQTNLQRGCVDIPSTIPVGIVSGN